MVTTPCKNEHLKCNKLKTLYKFKTKTNQRCYKFKAKGKVKMMQRLQRTMMVVLLSLLASNNKKHHEHCWFNDH
jgi:hypothetical protein